MTANSIQKNIFLNQFRLRRGMAFGLIILTALIAFEIFNYSTTDFALTDLLGDLKFMGIRWATILSIAFCGIDFAGIARLFTPETGADQDSTGHNEAWYLFGAWLLAATMNAMLTWWGISLAILGHDTLGNAVVSRETLLRVVPIFVAVLVWLIRVLIIGTFSVAGDRLFSQDEQRMPTRGRAHASQASGRPTSTRSLGNSHANARPQAARTASAAPQSSHATRQPAPKPSAGQAGSNYSRSDAAYSRPELTYHPASMNVSKGSSRNTSTLNSSDRSGSQF